MVAQQPDILEDLAVLLVVGDRGEVPRCLPDLPLWHYTGASNILFEPQPSVTKCDSVILFNKNLER